MTNACEWVHIGCGGHLFLIVTICLYSAIARLRGSCMAGVHLQFIFVNYYEVIGFVSTMHTNVTFQEY